MSDSDSGLPPDRIFLSNYVREMEIGAYPGERGSTQRLRFDITLEVARGGMPVGDDYTRVINYEDLVEAIETLARGPRMNLVETFAERLAELALVDPRARRVHIRIEKLDRLPGDAAYGIEIVRDRGSVSRERAWERGEAPG
ncbi:MAG TPA: dihydroneopterin aldolase [Paracoccaceae bacterium]|nr:dihydroneopterin aldolase [Paracoccaceae bacterium]